MWVSLESDLDEKKECFTFFTFQSSNHNIWSVVFCFLVERELLLAESRLFC